MSKFYQCFIKCSLACVPLFRTHTVGVNGSPYGKPYRQKPGPHPFHTLCESGLRGLHPLTFTYHTYLSRMKIAFRLPERTNDSVAHHLHLRYYMLYATSAIQHLIWHPAKMLLGYINGLRATTDANGGKQCVNCYGV